MRANTYGCRRGTSRRKTAPPDIYCLPFREIADDGTTILHVGSVSPTCPDCGRGHLQWAEAGYVAWHRICDRCGSHWDLHHVQFFILEQGPSWAPGWTVDVPQMLEGQDHVEALAAMVTAEHIAQAVDERCGIPVVDACWARRARFYCR